MDYGTLSYRREELSIFEWIFKDSKTSVSKQAEIVLILQDKIEKTVEKIKEMKPEDFNKISYGFDWALRKLKNSYETIENFGFYSKDSKILENLRPILPSGKDYLKAYNNVLNALEVVQNLLLFLDSSK